MYLTNRLVLQRGYQLRELTILAAIIYPAIYRLANFNMYVAPWVTTRRYFVGVSAASKDQDVFPRKYHSLVVTSGATPAPTGVYLFV